MENAILCIEDNPHNMLLMKRILEASGYVLFQSNTGLDGIRIAETENVGVILLDINLPDIDGYEVIRRLRSSQKTGPASIPIIVLSANALVGDDQKALSVGCNMYLTKPVDIQDLRDAVNKYVPAPNSLDE